MNDPQTAALLARLSALRCRLLHGSTYEEFVQVEVPGQPTTRIRVRYECGECGRPLVATQAEASDRGRDERA